MSHESHGPVDRDGRSTRGPGTPTPRPGRAPRPIRPPPTSSRTPTTPPTSSRSKARLHLLADDEPDVATLEGAPRRTSKAASARSPPPPGWRRSTSATFLLASAGDNVVSASSLYGGTYTYLTHTASAGVSTTRFVDTLDYDAYEEAIDDDTAYVHLETIGNPALVTPDFERVADIAHDHGAPLSSTTPSPRPPSVARSNTARTSSGLDHQVAPRLGTTVGGVVVDGGAFPWDEYPEKYPESSKPNPAYHGVNFAEALRRRGVHLRRARPRAADLGNPQSPFDAWQTHPGTGDAPAPDGPPLRERANRRGVPRRPRGVAWVNYPGLDSHETHENGERVPRRRLRRHDHLRSRGRLRGRRRRPRVVELASLLANVGDAKTLVIHPASTTHQQLTADEKESSGVTDATWSASPSASRTRPTSSRTWNARSTPRSNARARRET